MMSQKPYLDGYGVDRKALILESLYSLQQICRVFDMGQLEGHILAKMRTHNSRYTAT